MLRWQPFRLELVVVFLLIMKTVHSQCNEGFYSDSGTCYQCEASCKTWDNATAWTSWEDYMYLNSTSGLCTFCADGEYYDSTFSRWRDWEGIWAGRWAYQTTCFECSVGEMLDTDTLTWVSEWNSPKIQITNSQFNIASIWRGTDFYVNPQSSALLEIGSKDFPYQSMKALMSEVLNHHSNQDKEISIYLKENTDIYLEDMTNYFINITNIKMMSYSDDSLDPQMANLIPTRIVQNNESKKAAFSILQNTDLMLNDVLNASSLTESEINLLSISGITIHVVRTGLEIQNINIEREIIDLGASVQFLFPIYIQEKLINFTNVNFNVTGVIMYSYDPLNLDLSNILIDSYGLTDGFYMEISWNYPEAVTLGEFNVNNLTVEISIERTIQETPFIAVYRGPANVTMTDIDLTEYYSEGLDAKIGTSFIIAQTCTPDDGAIQTYNGENINHSLRGKGYQIFIFYRIHSSWTSIYSVCNSDKRKSLSVSAIFKQLLYLNW